MFELTAGFKFLECLAAFTEWQEILRAFDGFL
jgi:hypothetical protein